MNVSADLLSGILVAVVGSGGLWAYVGSRGKARTDLVAIAQDAAKTVIQSLTDEIHRLQERIGELEIQDERCRSELADLRRKIDG